jgi:hypothetical protein
MMGDDDDGDNEATEPKEDQRKAVAHCQKAGFGRQLQLDMSGFNV